MDGVSTAQSAKLFIFLGSSGLHKLHPERDKLIRFLQMQRLTLQKVIRTEAKVRQARHYALRIKNVLSRINWQQESSN
jgi:hypothetical protein